MATKNALITELVKNIVLEYLETHSAQKRQQILEACTPLVHNQLLAEKLSTLSTNDIRSRIGSILNELLSSKFIRNDNGLLSLQEEEQIIVRKMDCKKILLEYLKRKSYKKEDLIHIVIINLGAEQTPSKKDDLQIQAYVEELLEEFKSQGLITQNEELYVLKIQEEKKTYPKTPLDEQTFKALFLDRLHENGGPFFEKFIANLFEKYYTLTGRDVLECDVLGGSSDGGIDVQLKTIDGLGFVDHIVVQAKCRKNTQVTETEVRGFYGAMHVFQGSRGIFVTTGPIHPQAQKLLDSIDECVGIDGDQVFELAKKTLYGLHKTKNGFTFDDSVFMI